MLRFRDSMILAIALLLGGTIALYAKTLSFGFVNYDDPVYVTQNFDLATPLDLPGVLWAFGETRRSGHWHPLTWLSLKIDYHLFDYQAWGYHLTNLTLHTINTVLLFLILVRETSAIGPSLLIAGMFGWHPLHVESAAWISARKDLLSGLFWFATFLAYGQYVRTNTWRWYGYVLLFLALGLMSKPIVVTLPLVLCLWDIWPLGRGVHLREKVPMLLLVLGSCAITLFAMNRGGGLKESGSFPLSERLPHIAVAYVEYLQKAIWPFDLAPFYPRPNEPWPLLWVSGSLSLLATISLLCWRSLPLRTGWLWYLVTLLPVIGILPVGSQAWSDRYTYVPLIGILLVFAWLLKALRPLGFASVSLLSLVACWAISWQQIDIWSNSISLWQHTTQVTEKNFLAHTNLAYSLEEADRWDEAEYHFQQAIDARLDLTLGYKNLGLFYLRRQRWEDALGQFRSAARIDPKLVHLQVVPLRHLGRMDEADRIERENP